MLIISTFSYEVYLFYANLSIEHLCKLNESHKWKQKPAFLFAHEIEKSKKH